MSAPKVRLEWVQIVPGGLVDRLCVVVDDRSLCGEDRTFKGAPVLLRTRITCPGCARIVNAIRDTPLLVTRKRAPAVAPVTPSLPNALVFGCPAQNPLCPAATSAVEVLAGGRRETCPVCRLPDRRASPSDLPGHLDERSERPRSP